MVELSDIRISEILLIIQIGLIAVRFPEVRTGQPI